MKKTRKTRSLFRRRSDRRGATAVEFAFVAPAVLMLMFMGIEFTRIALMRSIAQSAVYEACRAAIVEGAVNAESLTEANRILARVGVKNAVIDVNGGNEITPTTQEVTVKIDIPMGDNCLFFGSVLGGRQVEAEATLRTERYTGYYDGSTTY